MNKNWLRYVSLLLFLALQCFLLLGILLATRVNTDSVLRGHTEEMMSHVVNNVTTRTRALLEPAESSVALSHSLIQTQQINALDNTELEDYFISQLENYKQFAGMYFGRPDGSFVFVKRDTSFTTPEGLTSSYRTKIISLTPQRSVELIWKDASGVVLSRQFDNEDTYDPRERPWYLEAQRYTKARLAKIKQNSTVQQSATIGSRPSTMSELSKATIWTDPYIFFSSMQPGITVASSVLSETGISWGTVGIDIELSDISHYLEMVAFDENDSFAFLKSIDNTLLAFPQFDTYLKTEEPRTLPQISDIKNKEAEAFLAAEALHAQAYPASKIVDFKVDKVPFVGTLQPISVIDGHHWLLGIHAPQKVYTGNITERYQQSMWQIIVLGLLCSLIAVPLSFGISEPLKRLHRQATTDSLTDLYDRSEFIRQAKQLQSKAKRLNKQLAYIMIDLDNFKPINDIYGHSTGDEVLVIVAKRLKDAIKANDLVARFGGDEFAICLYDVDPKNLRAAIERIRKTIEGDGIRSSQALHEVGVTAGVVIAKMEETPEVGLAFADNALVQGKVTRKGRSYFSDGSMSRSNIVQKRDGLHQSSLYSSIQTLEVNTAGQKEDTAFENSVSSKV